MGSDTEQKGNNICHERSADAFHRHHNVLSQPSTEARSEDAQAKSGAEPDASNGGPKRITPNTNSLSIDSLDKQIVCWADNDPENPFNFSLLKKGFILVTGILVVANSTLGSSLPSNAIPYITDDFHVTDPIQRVVPITIFLAGFVLGPLLFGPLSETYGRKVVLNVPFFVFGIFTMACALAPSWSAFIALRFCSGVSASAPLAVVPGSYADLYDDPVTRGRAMALFMGATCFGPLIAPVISGFISPERGWQWTFWIGLIIIAVCFPLLIFSPETYHPVLLTRRARHLRKTTSNSNLFSAQELETKGWQEMATVTLTRPIRMLFTELIVSASALYTSFAYAIFYMYFTAYPLVFQGIYGMSSGVAGLMFLPIGAGAFFATLIFLWYDSFLRRAQRQNKPWTQKEEARRLPLAYLGGPLYVVALLWLGWSARPDVPWIVPFLAGIPFGMGFVLIFMALLNYVADAYDVFAASALAGMGCCRSLAGAVLPFAAGPMYARLGIGWGSSLLGFLSLIMCVIPFAFVRYGETIRGNSRFCLYLKEKKEAAIREALDARRMEMGHEEKSWTDSTIETLDSSILG